MIAITLVAGNRDGQKKTKKHQIQRTSKKNGDRKQMVIITRVRLTIITKAIMSILAIPILHISISAKPTIILK